MSKVSVEQVKEESNYLRGNLAEELAKDTDHFDDAGKNLVKFHGMYQQDDRDARKDRKKTGQEPLYFFMVRSKIPGGRLDPDQYLVHDRLADEFGNGSIRLTTRQDIQLHGVFKKNIRAHIRALNDALVTTLGACGDVNRNVVCCPAPIHQDSQRQQMYDLTATITAHFLPQTRAYHEIWLNGEKVALDPPNGAVEPIYGRRYLPRKFKMAVTLPEDNCVDVLSNDIALLVRRAGERIEGYDVFVGGGMGMTHGMSSTYPRLASPLCFVAPAEVLDLLAAIVKVQRDHGNREDRKLARMKYLIDNWGEERFRNVVEDYYGKPLAPYSGLTVTGVDDHLGWQEQGDGKLWIGIHVLSGRIKDADAFTLKSVLRDIVRRFRPKVRIAAQQNLLLCDIEPKDRAEIDRALWAAGVKPAGELPLLTRYALACPAMPTCGLALADSERVLPAILPAIQRVLEELELSGEPLALHMTGCPNGCARPYNSDIGIVGRSPGKFTIFLGGNPLGTVLAFQYKDLVPQEQIPNVLREPLAYFKRERRPGESFSEFCHRKGADDLLARCAT
jgi:sulfite reductase (ferredoxin)